MSKRADKAAKNDGEQPVGLPIIEIATLFLNLLSNPSVAALIASCKKKPPTPPPVPASLVAEGITEETWKQANDSKFGSQNSVANNKKGFHAGVVSQVAI